MISSCANPLDHVFCKNSDEWFCEKCHWFSSELAVRDKLFLVSGVALCRSYLSMLWPPKDQVQVETISGERIGNAFNFRFIEPRVLICDIYANRSLTRCNYSCQFTSDLMELIRICAINPPFSKMIPVEAISDDPVMVIDVGQLRSPARENIFPKNT